MNIIDRYIIKKFLGTLVFMLMLLTIIVIVVDVQAKSPNIEKSGYTVGYFLLHFYPFWMIYLVITFMSILVFISVIYFTSRLANNTEIVAIISSGASFHRFSRPYFVSAFAIAVFSLLLNHYFLPMANVKKNKLLIYTKSETRQQEAKSNVKISAQMSPTEYVFINSYNRQENRGSGYMYQKFDKNKKLIQRITAMNIQWDKDKKAFSLNSYYEKKAGKNDSEILTNGAQMYQSFGHPPEELFPDELLGEDKTTPELIKFIQREKEKGNGNINIYLNELYSRTSMPVSIIILTILGLSLSSEKKRGGIGVNLALGIALAFVFIFSFEALKIVSTTRTLTPFVAMWLPNFVFAPVAVFLYFRRANQ
ncbi:LptF/LptG family permease [Riemerella columbipharyngis]|uniref:Lipopolysaccharide export system permease protein n=1 Tax=Riemerella columbipharyngis TaxID=1071918 RepID=A0A1G6YT93_9FLAO|nr:LptF/LptG family permease [Riemerella columbipharyngis]SDD93724.1 lipopolysaccharide export system permease protein [Riemerella columbipharyngis]